MGDYDERRNREVYGCRRGRRIARHWVRNRVRQLANGSFRRWKYQPFPPVGGGLGLVECVETFKVGKFWNDRVRPTNSLYSSSNQMPRVSEFGVLLKFPFLKWNRIYWKMIFL